MSRIRVPTPEENALIRKHCKYDPITGVLYKNTNYLKGGKPNWKVCKVDSNGYVRTSLVVQGKNRGYRGHRIAWFLYYGEWPKQYIDHINHIRDDNRISNLQDVAETQNNRNVSLNSVNTSGYPGVYWHKKNCRWVAKIWRGGKGGKWLQLGSFKDKDQAIKVRKAAEVKYGFHKNHGKSKA